MSSLRFRPPTRRAFLGACGSTAFAQSLAEPRPAIHFGFVTPANDGAWGGDLRTMDKTVATGILPAESGRSIADLTSEPNPRLVYQDARLAAVDDFSCLVAFNPARLGRPMIVVARPGRWRIQMSAAGILSLVTAYAASKAQSSTVTRLVDEDTWYRIAIAFDRSRRRLEFAFQQPGDLSSLSTGGFSLLPETLGPSTGSSSVLDIGHQRGGEPFTGYLAEVALYDHALPADGLRRLVESAATPPAAGSLPSLDASIFPVERDPGVLLPRRSDVTMSSRSWHPANANDPHDTMRDLVAFHATRLEWCASQYATPEHIRQTNDAGIVFCAKEGASDLTPGRVQSARDFDGNLIAFRWMVSWKQRDGLPPGACCVNNPRFRASLAGSFAELVRRGVAGMQYDDWASNLSVLSADGGCLCEFCIQRFGPWLKANCPAADLERWKLGGPAESFDFRRWLRAERGISSAAAYSKWFATNAGDPLRQAYARFQYFSVREGLRTLLGVLAANAASGRPRAPLSVNAFLDSTSQQSKAMSAGDLPDYFVGEAADESLTGLFLNGKIAEALHRTSIISPFPFRVDRTRSAIALQYALGQLCLAPYDIWMQTSDLPRHFGKAADYADLFAFACANAALLDSYEPVAAVGIAVGTAKPEDKRLRPLLQSIIEANVPFVFLLLGRDHFEPHITPVWAERVRHIINLTDIPDLPSRFSRARFWPGEWNADLARRIGVLKVEAPGVVATVRAVPGRANSAVIHLVNYNFDEFSQSATVAQCGVRLLQPGFWGNVRTAEILSPGVPARAVSVKSFGRGMRLVVPELRTWAVVRLNG